MVVHAWLKQGNLLPTSEAVESFACSFIAETHETDYAKLEKGTELPLGTPEAPHAAKSENAAHDIGVCLGNPYVTIASAFILCISIHNDKLIT